MVQKCSLIILLVLFCASLMNCSVEKDNSREDELNKIEKILNDKQSRLDSKENKLKDIEAKLEIRLMEIREKEEKLESLKRELKTSKVTVAAKISDPEIRSETNAEVNPDDSPERTEKATQSMEDEAFDKVIDAKMLLFRKQITAITKAYIGMPYEYGAVPDKFGKADNSHLIISIYKKAAREAGLDFSDYMPMKELLLNTYEIKPVNIRSGDIHVLSNNHAAIIYEVDDNGNYLCAYTSEKKREVLSADSSSKDFKAYWIKHLKGYFRLKDELFKSP